MNHMGTEVIAKGKNTFWIVTNFNLGFVSVQHQAQIINK